MMAEYRLIVTVELERLDSDGSMAWRGSGNVQIQADIVTLLMLAQRDGLMSGVQSLAQRIVGEENAKHHG